MPASTDGSAAQSIKSPTSPTPNRSSRTRTSPWTNRTPPCRRRCRLSSLPRRRRLSNAMTSASGRVCLNRSARLDPTKPAPPVTKILFIADVGDDFVLDAGLAMEVRELLAVLRHQVVVDEAALGPGLHHRGQVAPAQRADVELGRSPGAAVPVDLHAR